MSSGDYFEEDFEDRKESRKQRRRIQDKDRSKFKKSEKKKFENAFQKEVEERVDNEQLKRGRVLTVTSQIATVSHEGKIYQCVTRGLLKRENRRMKTLVVVGDFVQFFETTEGEGCIVHVEERKSVLSRAENLSQRKEQLIAVNVDQVLVTASVVDPPLKPPLLDRYLIASRKGGMTPIIVINKVDLLDSEDYPEDIREEQRALLEESQEAYTAAGIPFLTLSADLNEGLERLEELMKNKASVFSGQSGVGKSSLINVMTGLDLRVGRTVGKTRKGAHTTSQASLVPLEFGGWCVDTPGIKSFGVWDLEESEIADFFPEIQEESQNCHFPSCTHDHEPKCAVKQALEEERISALRYESYLRMLDSVRQEHRPR